jgi:hypothetical protein
MPPKKSAHIKPRATLPHHTSVQVGSGIISSLQNLGARLTDDPKNPKNRLYPSEKHALIYNTRLKRYEPAQFMGPGTEYLKRSRLGQNGLSYADTESKAHDIRYALGTSNEDIKKADDIFYRVVNKAASQKLDVPWNTNQAKLLKIKDYIPFVGSTYGDKRLSDQDKQYLSGELRKLEQRGFGKKINHAKNYAPNHASRGLSRGLQSTHRKPLRGFSNEIDYNYYTGYD